MKKMRYLTELRGADLTHAEYRLLVTLWTYTDKECRNAFPSVRNLADDMGRTDIRRVQRELRQLAEKGYVSASGGLHGGRGMATRYALTLPEKGGREGRERVAATTTLPAEKGGREDHPLAKRTAEKGGREGRERVAATTTPSDHDQKSEGLRTSVVASSRAHTPAPAREADHAEPKPKRGTRLPADFIPSEKSRRTILDESPALDLRREHSRFVDYWTSAPGQRGVKLDWNATWRNWMRKAADSQNRGRNGAPTRQQQTDDLFDRAFQRAAAADAADAARATIRGELA